MPIQNPVAEPLLPYASGILATKAVLDGGVVGIGEQFRSEAQTYDERYFDIEPKAEIIARALDMLSITMPGNPVALDIGCGTGGATFAMLRLFPQAHVYATDLSPEMMVLLTNRARQLGVIDRITSFVSDASTLSLSDNSFDIIVGSSMLHHLMEPTIFLDRVLRSVKRGGAALFCEPFQAGHIVLRTLFTAMVELAPYKGGLTDRRIEFFRNYIFTIDAMCREDRDPAFYARLDDKWMFETAAFRDTAKRNECHFDIFSINPPTRSFAINISDLLRQGLGDKEPLPDWAQKMIDETDAAVSRPVREELLLSACIAFSPQC